MELKCVLILCCVIYHGAWATDELFFETFSRLLSETKTELAKSYFRRDLTDKEASKFLNLTHSNLEELKLSNPTEIGRMFRNADENFLYNGVEVLQLQKSEPSKGRYTLNAVDDIRFDEGAVFFKIELKYFPWAGYALKNEFVQTNSNISMQKDEEASLFIATMNEEWKNKIFLAVCYLRGYCEIRMSAHSFNGHIKLRIDTGALPRDVTFFGTDENFFFITVQDPVVIYRWTGTYFNEHHNLDTTGARSVSAFQDNDRSIIIVAQNLGANKVYSKVYVWKNDKIELFQLLPTSQALKILPFELTHRKDVLRFVFVLNNISPSAIFWWTGKEFVLWKSLENIFGSRIIYVGRIQTEIFFFISSKNKIYVYHPTVTSFDLMQIITFDQEVVGIDLRHEKDQMPMLVLLTGSASDPYFKVNLILLRINYASDLEKEDKSSGGILQCLLSVQEELSERKMKLDRIYSKVAKGREPDIGDLVFTSLEDSLWKTAATVLNLQQRLESARNESMAVSGQSRRYQVYGDLKIDRMTADRIDAEVLNGAPVQFDNLLSLTRDQVIGGDVELKTLSADILNASSIKGVAVEDLLVRNKETQKMTGEFTLASITAKNINFGPSAKLNKIPSADLMISPSSKGPITERKIIRKVKAKQVEVQKINNVSSEEWLAEILPSLGNQNEQEPLNFTELSAQKLWVSNLNGIPWDNFVNSVWLPLNNETIKGDVRATGVVKVKKLKAEKLNGISVSQVLARVPQPNPKCRSKPPKKSKSLLLELSRIWDDTFLKEVLNEPGSKFDDEVRYFTGTQKVDGDLRASQVFLRNPVELSGSAIESFENLKDRYWMKSEDQIIRGPVEFKNGITINSSIRADRVNGKSINSFVWTDRSNSVPARLIFEDAFIKGNVSLAEDVIQNVNLKEIEAHSAKTTGENLISGRKRFLGSLTTENLKVEVLNDMAIEDFMVAAKETLEDSGNVEVSELVIFGDLEVRNETQVKRINDVDFNETVSRALTWDDPEVFRKARFQSLSVRNLDVNTINGLSIEDKLPKLSKTQNKDVYVVVEGNFEIPKLNAIKVNGINFDKYINQIVQINETQTIRGEKIFKEMVTVTGDLKGSLNEYNISELEKTALFKSKPQVVTGMYTVEELQANDVKAKIIDGLPADHLLYQDNTSVQIINSDVIFNSMAVVGDIEASNFMNDCDLTKMSKVNAKDFADFENMVVKGDLSWNFPRDNTKGLSYFLSNVVTKKEDQIITGPVEFENHVVMRNVGGEQHFNDVDLEFISKDAIYQSLEKQEISALVTFKGGVKANNVRILDNVLIDSINGVDITELAEKLVKKSADTVVKGKKIFKKGFSANHLDADAVNGVKTNSIVFYDDLAEGKEMRLPFTTFRVLNVFGDLNVLRINGHTLDSILDQRMSKTEDQILNGRIMIEGDVTITGDGNIQTINDVSIEETILADEKVSAKVITGDIEFRDTISIADKLEVDYINGQNITALLEKALMVDEDAIIEGDIEFSGDVIINGDIKVEKSVNNCDLNKITQTDFTDSSDETNHRIRESLRKEVGELLNLTKTLSIPVVFMYLRESARFDLELPTIHAISAHKHHDSVRFSVYGMSFGSCGLPSECYCPAQTNLKITSLKRPSIEVEANMSRFFTYYDESLKIEVKVSTTTVSYSSRCKRSDDEIDRESTSISWRKTTDEEGDAETQGPEIYAGFLSDVKFFKLGNSIYIIMAFYFHPTQVGTNNLNTTVYELDVPQGKVDMVDEIPSSGAQVLEVFWTTKGVILVIGNSFDSDRFTDSVKSAIYRFNEYENKFELLRFVKTHGILSIKSIRYEKTSFIFFVQKQTWPLLILKYNQEYDNYYFSQKLDTEHSLVRSNFLSVSVISTMTPGHSGDLFVGIVLSDDSFRLFKYKHIEGFVEESYQEQNNVRALQPFWIGSTQYLLAASASDTSKIYSFVEQGR